MLNIPALRVRRALVEPEVHLRLSSTCSLILAGGFEITSLGQAVSIRGFSGFASRFAGRECSLHAHGSVSGKSVHFLGSIVKHC